jgi:hypothetical protein
MTLFNFLNIKNKTKIIARQRPNSFMLDFSVKLGQNFPSG